MNSFHIGMKSTNYNIMNKFQSIRRWIWASIYKDLDFIFRGVKVSVQEHLQKRVVAFWNVWPSSGIYRPRRKDLWKNMLEFHCDVAFPSSIILPIFRIPLPLRLCKYPWNQRCKSFVAVVPTVVVFVFVLVVVVVAIKWLNKRASPSVR